MAAYKMPQPHRHLVALTSEFILVGARVVLVPAPGALGGAPTLQMLKVNLSYKALIGHIQNAIETGMFKLWGWMMDGFLASTLNRPFPQMPLIKVSVVTIQTEKIFPARSSA